MIESQLPLPISRAIIKQIAPALGLLIGPCKTPVEVTEKSILRYDNKHGMITMRSEYLIIDFDNWYIVLLPGECLEFEVFGRKNIPYEFVDWCRAMEAFENRPRRPYVKRKTPRRRFYW